MDGHLEDILAWLLINRGKVLGTAAGLLLGWLTLRYGIIKALFVILCVLIGYGIGARVDDQQDGRGLLGGLFSSRRR